MTKRGRFLGRVARFAVASAAVLGAAVPGVADAAQSVTNGSVKCTVTAAPPSLTLTYLSSYVMLTCNGVTSVEVTTTYVELDGTGLTTEDSKWVVRPLKTFVSVTSRLVNVAIKIPTAIVQCGNTDLNEKEEFATKAMLNLGGKTSAWDRTVPTNNSYSC